MVVDIYGSKEVFVNEYRSLLADRLLSQLDFNTDREQRNLELLKLRFDETMLHTCQVMLKDITDSKRINSHIQTTIEAPENGKLLLLVHNCLQCISNTHICYSSDIPAIIVDIVLAILAIV